MVLKGALELFHEAFVGDGRAREAVGADPSVAGRAVAGKEVQGHGGPIEEGKNILLLLGQL